MKMTGAQALLEAFKQEGVDVIFGYPGGVVLPISDALYHEKAIRHVLVRHEQGAAHAADGYARATGKVGVCLATSGPGATNLVTGLATAYMDSIPVVAITGQVPTPAIGRDSFQEADITGITMPITKHNYLVKDVRELPRVIKEAFYIASTGRRGPVLIDLPRDVSQAELDFEYPDKAELRSYQPQAKGHSLMIKRAAELIASAERPVIIAGGGAVASDAADELRKLAELINAPVTTTLMGKGVFPERDALALGMPGMHGTAYANYALNGADVIIAIGMRFDDRVTGKLETFAPNSKFVHIDIDPAEIGKSVKPTVPIVGDVKQVLAALLKRLEKQDRSEWMTLIAEWKQRYPLSYKGDGLKPQMIVEQIYDITNGDAIITTEVGQNQMWAAQFYPCKRPRQFLSSGGLGTMGYGFPAAIGAQIACPDAVVWDIAGDGSIQMNIQELGTAVANELPVKVAILNNGYLGMVRQWQELFFGKRYSCVDLAAGMPDFVKLAEAYGAVGIRVDKDDEVRPALRKAMRLRRKPCLIDFRVCREENVMPMVPAGGSIDQMMID
ncbi:MAG: biosynthetic-type acetolactate synthase large subunit [Armatimonadota bacterium]|nr:MAG: biosynthetic-type acetolactate synthase large subunit [Armatimonadota bacterium]